jgi:hypothetical protein
MGKIAFIITVYKNDKREFFKQAIKSIVNQDYGFDNINIYLGVDGDLSDEVRGYIHENQVYFYKIIQNQQNRGLAFTLNRVIEVLEDEEYIFRMDSDDICKSMRVAEQVKFMDANTDVDISGSAIAIIDDMSNHTGQIVKFPLLHNECFIFFKRRDPVAHPSVVFRKSYFNKAGLYPDIRKNQDTFFWGQGFKNGCIFANVDKVLLKFRMSDSLYTRRGNVKNLFEYLLKRYKINNDLKLGIGANFYATMYFVLQMMPSGIKKVLYKKLR